MESLEMFPLMSWAKVEEPFIKKKKEEVRKVGKRCLIDPKSSESLKMIA